MKIEIIYTIAEKEFTVEVNIPDDKLPETWEYDGQEEEWIWDWIWENTLYTFRRL